MEKRIPPLKGDTWKHRSIKGFTIMFNGETRTNVAGDPFYSISMSRGAEVNPSHHGVMHEYLELEWEPVSMAADEKPPQKLPHKCPCCASGAFVMTRTVECSNAKCRNYVKEIRL